MKDKKTYQIPETTVSDVLTMTFIAGSWTDGSLQGEPENLYEEL